MKRVELDPEAADEIRDAIAYLEGQRPGCGADFEADVQDALDLIGRQPKAFSPYPGGYRKFVVSRFGYVIFYAEYDDHVWVAAVHHGRRQPNYWQHRRPGP